MKKLVTFFVAIFLLLPLSLTHAEDVKITTYYPSPYGSYKQLSVEDGGSDVDKYGSLQITRELNNHLGSHVAFIRNGSTRMGLGYKQSSDTFGFGPGVTVASAAPFNPNYLSIDSAGNVGIGTSSPQATLDVGPNGGAILVPRNADDPTTNLVNGMVYYNTTDNKFKVYQNDTWSEMTTGGGGAIGAPSYDSGWVTSPSAGSTKTYTHNLGTLNYMVYLEGRTVSGDHPAGTIHQVNNPGGTDASWVDSKKTNSVVVMRHTGDSDWDETRVRCWKW